MAKISVCLATFNEEKNIKDCLESVRRLANEIVVVDGTSTDKTVTIAKKYGARVIVRENPPMFHINKQKAFEAATGDWILYLDADERVTPGLEKEVREAIYETKYDGFWLPRKNIIFSRWIEHTGWYPDYQLRLFRRGRGYLPCKSVHEQLVLTGKAGSPRVEAGHLKNPLIHYNYQSISQFVTRLNNYTENDKNLFLGQGKTIEWYDAIRFPTAEFFKRFFLEQGYKDGLHGLVLSVLQSFSSFVTFAKIWEAEGFKPVDSQDFLARTQKELAKAVKETKYWFLTAKVKNASNLAEKIWFRILRKTN